MMTSRKLRTTYHLVRSTKTKLRGELRTHTVTNVLFIPQEGKTRITSRWWKSAGPVRSNLVQVSVSA